MMKGLTPKLLLLAALAVPAASQADTGFYAGGGATHTQLIDADTKLLEELNTMSFLAGYEPAAWRGFAVEGQLLEGQVTYDERGDYDDDLRFDYTSIAAYGVFRTERKFLFKARIGVLWQDWESNDRTSLNRDEFIGSAGIGFGVRLGRGKLEFERLFNDSDLRQLTVNYTHGF